MKNIRHCYEISLHDKTLWVRAIGVWTVRDLEDYIKDFRTTANSLIRGPWALVLDARRWETSPNDIFAGILDNSNWCIRNNLAHVVALLPQDHVIGWQFVKATSVEVPESLVKQRANTDEEARAMLIAAGFLQHS